MATRFVTGYLHCNRDGSGLFRRVLICFGEHLRFVDGQLDADILAYVLAVTTKGAPRTTVGRASTGMVVERAQAAGSLNVLARAMFTACKVLEIFTSAFGGCPIERSLTPGMGCADYALVTHILASAHVFGYAVKSNSKLAKESFIY